MPQQKPWEKYGSAPQAAPSGMPGGSVMIAPPAPDSPYKAPKARADLEETELRNRKLRSDLANGNRPDPPSGFRWRQDGTLEFIPGGPEDPKNKPARFKALRESDGKGLEGDVNTYSALQRTLGGFQDDYGGNLLGEGENWVQNRFGAGTPGQAQWWADFRATDNVIRNSLYGASLTEGEKAAYNATTVQPSMDPAQIRTNLARRAEILRQAIARHVARYKAGGYNPDEIDAALGEYGPDFAPKQPGKTSQQDQKQPVVGAISSGNSIPPVSGGTPPIVGGGGPQGPTGPQSNPLNYAQGQYGDSTTTQVAGATKSIPNETGIQFMKGFNSLFHADASDERIRAYASQFGIDPSPQLAYRKANPGFRGSIPITPGGLSITVPNDSASSRFAGALAGSAVGTGIGEAGNAALAGLPQWTVAALSDNPDLVRARFGVARSMNPRAAIAGQLIGGTLGAIGGEGAALKGAGMLGRAFKIGEGAQDVLNFGGRRVGDALFGGVSGATGAEPGQSGQGAIKGALAGTFGGMLGEGAGRYAIEPTTRPIGRLFSGQTAPSPSDNALFKAVGNNAPDINAQLGEASNLNLPMTLADTNPALRSLAGASVRRSPNASGLAENVLLPRNRGQIDRFSEAINRDLGPIGNVPQTSQDLQAAARAKAGPLYDQAYAAPPVNDPALTALLNNPQMKPAYDAANMFREQDATLAAARGQPVPPPLAGPNSPDIRTLDYIKRGLDGKIRTAFTGGDPQAAMSGPFYKDARNILLSKADAAVPAYAQARLSYGGPMRAMDAMEAGQKAVRPGMTADQLGVDLGKIGPGDMPQIQLGYRSGLMDQANNVRTNGNPYEATLGTTNAEAKLGAIYPDNPHVSRLLRQRDLERQMQNTSSDILGNSKTAQRGIADEAFSGEDLPQLALDTGINAMLGQVPIGTMVKVGTGQAMRDLIKFGVGKKAVAKADILAPTLLNPDPAASSAELSDILARSQGYRDYLSRRRGMFGRGAGIGGAGMLTGYSTSQ